MKQDARYEVIKAIPLGNGKEIPLKTAIYRRHGVYYMDGGLLSQSYQEDFDNLISYEEAHGWNYICPIVTKTGKSEI